MALLEPAPNQPLTLEQKQNIAKNSIVNISRDIFNYCSRLQKDGIKAVWKNPHGLTPQEVIDALGTDAVKVFAMHAALTQLIVGVAQLDGVQPNISLPTFAFTKHQDGTITVKGTPYIP
jgi:hypothetical protein